jgi:hypothetical protein
MLMNSTASISVTPRRLRRANVPLRVIVHHPFHEKLYHKKGFSASVSRFRALARVYSLCLCRSKNMV